MDVVYDFVESVHVFIPIVAVVFFIFVIFLFTTGKSEQQPTEEFLDRLHQKELRTKHKAQHSKPQSAAAHSNSSKSPTSAVSSSPVLPSHNTSSSTAVAKTADTGVTTATTVRQRKGKTKETTAGQQPSGDNAGAAHEIEDQDDGWVTVTPRKKQAGGKTRNDEDSDEAPIATETFSKPKDMQLENTPKSEVDIDVLSSATADAETLVVEHQSSTVVGDTSVKSSTIPESPTKKSKGARKKKPRPAFEIEEPTFDNPQQSSSVNEDVKDKENNEPTTMAMAVAAVEVSAKSASREGSASGDSVEVGVDAAAAAVDEDEEEKPDVGGGGDDGWQTMADKRKKNKKKKNVRKKELTAGGDTGADLDDDQYEIDADEEMSSSPITQSKTVRRVRARRQD